MFNFFKKNKDENKKENTLKSALSKTINSLINNVTSIANDEIINEYEFDDIESMLIKADLGVNLSVELVEKLKDRKIKSSELKPFLKEEFINILNNAPNEKLKFDKDKINIYFVVGVNGAGKTTLIGKLAYKFKQEGKRVLVAAADTFRAAAEEQLDIWSTRAGADIV